MAVEKPRILMRIEFEAAAQKYLESLPMEHFMEAKAQGTQRQITLGSLALLKEYLKNLHLFNELLVQYRRRQESRIYGIVPDNMVVIWDGELRLDGSFDVPLQPCGPFWVLEYVSKHNKRKDYEQSFDVYERDLKVPYYLLFYPDDQELSLFRHGGRKYHSVRANVQGRHPIAELELEVALLDGWVRYWFRGELLPLPGDLLKQVEQGKQKQAELEHEVAAGKRKQTELENKIAQLNAQLARLQGPKNGK